MMRSTLTALLLFITPFIFGQVQFESPYVYEGRSFSLELPSDYYQIGESGGRYEPFVYSTDKDQEVDAIMKQPETNVILINYMGKRENMTSINDLLDEMNKELGEESEMLGVIAKPEIVEFGSFKAIATTIELKDGSTTIPELSIGFFLFGNYQIMVNVAHMEQTKKIKSRKELLKILETYNDYETDREDAFAAEETDWEALEEAMEALEELEEEEVIEERLYNTEFETSLTPYGIYFTELFNAEQESIWTEIADPDEKLLAAFTDVYEEGIIRVFSGGDVSNYKEKYEYTRSVAKVIDPIENITHRSIEPYANGEYQGMMIHYVDCNLDIPFFLTVPIHDEVLFIVVEFSNDVTGSFKNNYKEFIDSFIYAEE